MDGLLLNTEDLYEVVIREILQERGKVFRPEVRMRMMGQPAPQAWGVLIEAEGLEDRWETLQREAEERFRVLLPRDVALMPGGIRRCVATSSRRSFATEALGLAGILDRFEFLICGDEVARGKPAPDIYLQAARSFQLPPEDLLVLEDSSHGTAAARAAGCFVVAVPGDHSRHQDFAQAHLQVDRVDAEAVWSIL
jgi:HAD superfamily hydrolase (TIGR01509 family)